MISVAGGLSSFPGSPSPDESCGFQVGCGSGKRRFYISFLQRFATPKGALFFLCCASIAQGFIISGLFGVIVSTLEKRFHLHSTETGLIASSYDISSCISVLIITYIGGRGHKPLWIGWGVFLIGIGSIVFSSPHYFAPSYVFGEEVHNVCNSTIEQGKCMESSLKSYMGLFVVGQLLHGIGGTTLFTLGVTYLDENVKQVHSSLYHGIYYSSAVLGPAMGFLLGSRFLTIYTNLGEIVEITESSSLWIGAWWLGFIVGGVLLIILSIPILMLPKQLPNTEDARMGRENEIHGGKMGEDGIGGSRFSHIWHSIVVLLRNPTFILVTLAATMDSCLVVGLTTFGPKYLESMFALSPTQAATYFGILAILAGASGQFLGGFIVTKARLSVPGILQFCSVCSFIATASSFIFFQHCPDIKFAGATMPYMGESNLSSTSHVSMCNQACNCNNDLYDPVCGGDGVTYYSPCFAGCEGVFDNKTYSDCGCVTSNFTHTATPGVCMNTTCATRGIFLFIFFISILSTFSAGTPAVQAVLRVVPFTQRSFAIGVKFVILRVVGSIPGPILFGRVLDLACVVWSSECGEQGFCQLYKNVTLSSNMATLIVVLKSLALLLFISAWLAYKPPTPSLLDNIHRDIAIDTIPTTRGSGGGISELLRHRPESKFDSFTYSKGASFLRMVQGFLGEQTFTDALTNYLNDLAYSSATHDDLFQHWIDQAATDGLTFPYPLQDVFETWTLQMGYPLITMERVDASTILLTQEYFLVDPKDSAVDTPGSLTYKYKWYVPFTYRGASEMGTDTTNTLWMDLSGTANLNSNEDYILGNIEARGFYRINYDDNTWSKLSTKLASASFKDIPVENRAQLIDDIFALSRATKIEVNMALELAAYLSQEDEYIPWYTFNDAMQYFDSMLGASPIYGDFSQYILDLVVPSLYNKLGWDDSNTDDSVLVERMTRGLAIDAACYYGNEECIANAKQLFQEWMNDTSTIISSTYRTDVYCTAIREGGLAEWDFMWAQYLVTQNAQLQTSLRYGLSCSKDAWILNRYIEYAMDSTLVRKQDVSNTLYYISSKEHGKYVAWSFAANNWERLLKNVGSAATSLLSGAVSRFSTDFDLDLVESMKNVTGPGYYNTLESYKTRVQANIDWRARNEALIADFLGSSIVIPTSNYEDKQRSAVVPELNQEPHQFHRHRPGRY
ncbi:solute carrier organic anion transporter family member 4A1 [Ciona intestinalis]